MNQGADMKTSITNSGANVLLDLCRNHDASADVCRWILTVEPELLVEDYKNLKWKLFVYQNFFPNSRNSTRSSSIRDGNRRSQETTEHTRVGCAVVCCCPAVVVRMIWCG